MRSSKRWWQLSLVDRQMANDDLVFKPFGKKAHDFIRRPVAQDEKYSLLEGSVRSSKTFAIDAKLITQLCSYKVGGKRVICGATKGTVYKNILLDLFTVVGKKNYSYNSSTGELWLFGTLWFVIGAKDEASYKQILGMTIGIAICDEWTEFPRSFTMQLFLRMSSSGSRLYATTNPGTPQHYLYTEVLHGKSFAPDLEVIHFVLDDNPNIEKKEKARIIASQSGVYYQRYILGLWVAAEGAIYKDAWKDKLLYSKAPLGLYGQGGYVNHVISVDYGTTNPCVFLEYIDDGKTIWEDREYWWNSVKEMKQKTDGEYADDLLEFIKTSRIQGASPKIVVDPSAASFKAELSKRGLWVVDADNDVDAGIRRVASSMNLGLLRVHEENVNAKRETGVYVWDQKKVAKGEEVPLKVDDHTQDARRYALMDMIPQWRIAA
jgi:PBSX family phage terminase large subunit